MNNSVKTPALILAAGTAGVTLFALASASFTAGVRGDMLVAAAVSIALIGCAVIDYSRRTRSLSPSAKVLRPLLPAGTAPLSAEFGTKSDRANRVAA